MLMFVFWLENIPAYQKITVNNESDTALLLQQYNVDIIVNALQK